jgi:hypothetical protein
MRLAIILSIFILLPFFTVYLDLSKYVYFPLLMLGAGIITSLIFKFTTTKNKRTILIVGSIFILSYTFSIATNIIDVILYYLSSLLGCAAGILIGGLKNTSYHTHSN